LVVELHAHDRVGVDTEADSLHSYREKLCLLQISVSIPDTVAGIADAGRDGENPHASRDQRSGLLERSQPRHHDFIVDPLAGLDLTPLARLLEEKEIVLHGADYDLRLLRRGMNLVAKRIFDTVIGARLIGIREFSLAALVERYFGVKLAKGSQKANWAQRPLPARMEEYARNDTRYLLPLADRLGDEMDGLGRLEWFHQSCQRAVDQAAVDRVRDADEAWRIAGAGALRGQAGAVLRALWNWREKEAEAADRPPFHILQNRELLSAAEKFVNGAVPDYKYFSDRRRRAFRDAAAKALKLPEKEWPVWRKGSRKRSSAAIGRRIEELRRRREGAAKELGLEPSFIAPRAAIEAIAVDADRAGALLVPWQRRLLAI
jgi:ribonuclease D